MSVPIVRTFVLCAAAAGVGTAHAEPRWVWLLDGAKPPITAPSGGTTLPGGVTVAFDNGVLHITDTSKAGGGLALYAALWNADPTEPTELEGQVKLIAAEGVCGMCLDFADGVHEDALSLFPDHISLWGAQLTYAMNTTDDFHTYRIRIQNEDVQVFVDGQLVIDGRGRFTTPAGGHRNNCQFGAGSSSATGEALWKTMRFQMRRPRPPKINVPKTPGLDVRVGDTILIQPNAVYSAVFQFSDGRISAGGGSYDRGTSYWSTDSGHTWKEGPAGPNNAAIELGKGEILSLGFNTRKRPDGKYSLPQKRSLDGWRTVTDEIGLFDIPKSVPCGGDAAETNDGFLLDHGIIRLRNGDLMATMYGNYEGDVATHSIWPKEYHFRFYRTIAVFSSDKGKTWGNPVTIAYTDNPEKVQEGFCEADLARVGTGDILCVMRSGGSFGKHYPCYICRSSDEGRTWSEPVVIDDKGVWPNLCVMKNGVLVCTYGRPGNWLSFSTDDGRTWKGTFRFYEGTTSSYNSVLEVAPDTILVIYDRQAADENGVSVRREIVGAFFTVKKR